MPPRKATAGSAFLAHLGRGRNLALWLGALIMLACLGLIYRGFFDFFEAFDNNKLPQTTWHLPVGWIGVFIGFAIIRYGLAASKARDTSAECPACGAPNSTQAAFCDQCGAALGEFVRCEACERPMPPSAKFCPNCGKPI